MDKAFRYRIACKQYMCMCMCMYSQKIHCSILDTPNSILSGFGNSKYISYITVSCCSWWVLIATRSVLGWCISCSDPSLSHVCCWEVHMVWSLTNTSHCFNLATCLGLPAIQQSTRHILLGWIGHNIATLFYAQSVTTYSGTHYTLLKFIVFQLHLMVSLLDVLGCFSLV